MDKQQVIRDLHDVIKETNFSVDELLKDHTYTKLGGKADVFVTPDTIDEVQQVIKYANAHDIPFTLLGNGSNVIIRDGGIRGIVLSLKKFATIQRDGNKVIAQSGARIIDASRFALNESLTGLEFACGIPGTVGGALYMNAGAYGGEVKDCLAHALVVDRFGEVHRIAAEGFDLAYRTSNIAEKGYIVLEATFQLEPGDAREIKAMMDDLTNRRESKQPLEYPSCGSVFKRPPGYFAGKLIQDSDLQGKGVGGAEVSTKHAGFIVNKSDATATEYISVIEMVQRTVKEKFGVALEREVRILGEDEK
ncbi:UDP-N-acetylenolpyruvoylglucosamine reductase [Gracilibacillus halophilus YIM-C55.5]|uniref:UDP-N-acetylenolpyruvoylglucosamine reductase n=1 Tax=Gracilibacillus halophilus YIM-C55.5 TaxID=1308866 RepID=N4WPV3_9BACI|nr:UDP-N-acetylmuramate dehydrogenase [Gracilibacillus halophilus]ENH96485.1 UDP-N-acetylenolpyruvoylglucosamine reductase [Gracilibacillus halophilus YIM-C55.5]